MNSVPVPAERTPCGNYQVTRFNALRHGVLSRYTVLPWEDEAEYQILLGALVAEHAPQGPTEEHLVEELAGVIWRKRRLRMAEAAVYREKLRHDATSVLSRPCCRRGAAPNNGGREWQGQHPKSHRCDPSRDSPRFTRLEAGPGCMTQRSLNVIQAGGPGAYESALAALRTSRGGHNWKGGGTVEAMRSLDVMWLVACGFPVRLAPRELAVDIQ